MAGQTSRGSSLLWTSVIEAVINVEDIDVITLINLFKKSSKITSDVESKARDMISFKILERLFDPDDRPIKSARCARNCGLSFDYSERCEDVLQQILGKMNDPNKWDESEKSKWNVKSFIAYKRRVMDMPVEGKTSYLTLLNQLVKSRKLNQDGTKIPNVNGAVINNQQKSPCIDDNVCRDTSNDGDRSTRSGTLNGEHGDKVCHYISYEGNKRTRTGDSCDEDGDKVCHDISNKRTRTGDLRDEDGDKVCDDISNEIDKRTRIGDLCDEDGDKVCHDISTEGNKRTRIVDLCDEDGDKVCHSISTEGSKRTRIVDLCDEDGDKVCLDISTEGNKITRIVDLCDEDGDKVCLDISTEGNKIMRIVDLCDEDGDKVSHDISSEGNKRTRMGDLCDEGGDKVCQDTSNEGNRSARTGLYSDDECYQKELSYINVKKEAFFSSNWKDKEGFTDQKDVNRCMKCKKGGQLLICSSNACLFVFHESCLVSSTPFDYDSSENFYCPFCKYSQSISDYWVAKKKTLLARNHLAAFGNGDNKNIESRIPNIVLDPDVTKKMPEFGKEGCNERSPERERADNKNIESRIPNIVLDPDVTNKMTELGKEGCNEKSPERERADIVDCSRKFQKPTNSFTHLFFPQRRRVPVPWTQSEEETLKKWVEKFKSCNDIQERGFPWSKILELGASTFQKSRIPGDLKDKWRNMQKAVKKST